MSDAVFEASTNDETLFRERKFHSIVPRSSVAGTALTLVIAIMAFMASLTLGAVSMINDTARGWQSEIAREITIQIRPVDDVDMDKSLILARQIAGSMTGVNAVSVVDEETTARLLEPWLGSGLDLNELPIPRLISVSVNEKHPPDLDVLRARLVKEVPGASLDDHRAWVDRLTTMAQATIFTGLGIFLLMMAATVLTVVFATRGAMAGNKNVIEVLHFVGAEQGYIAAQFQKHFLLLGLKGALVGGVLAFITFMFIGWWASRNVADPSADQVAALFGTFSVGLGGYVGTLVLIFVIALLTALTSRLTVLRHVGTLDRSSGDD